MSGSLVSSVCFGHGTGNRMCSWRICGRTTFAVALIALAGTSFAAETTTEEMLALIRAQQLQIEQLQQQLNTTRETLQALNDQGISVVLVTHEREIAAAARRVISFRDGRVQSDERIEQSQYFRPAISRRAASGW